MQIHYKHLSHTQSHPMSVVKPAVIVPRTLTDPKTSLLKPVVITADKKSPSSTEKSKGKSRSLEPRESVSEVTLRYIWPSSVQLVARDAVHAVLQVNDALWLNATRDNDDCETILTAPGVTRVIHDKILLHAAADASVLLFEDGSDHTIQTYLPDECHFSGTLSLKDSQVVLEAMGATILIYDTQTGLYSVTTALEYPPSGGDDSRPLTVFNLDQTVIGASLSVDGQALLCTMRVSNSTTGVYCVPLSSVVSEDSTGWHLLGEGGNETFVLLSDTVAIKHDTLKRVVHRMIVDRNAAPNTPFVVDEKSAVIANVVDCQVDATHACVWIYTLTGSLHRAIESKISKAVKTPDDWLTIETHPFKTNFLSHGARRQGGSFAQEVLISRLAT